MSIFSRKKYVSFEDCPLRKGMKILGGKWSLIILAEIDNGNNRFGKLKQCIPDLSEKMLVTTLRLLVDDNLLTKEEYFSDTLNVEYTLTSRGVEALSITNVLISLYKK